MKPPPDLARVIGFWSGLAIVIGNTIGSGIFRKPGTIAIHLQDPALTLVLWAAFGLVCLCGALTVAELACLLPRSGGTYVFLREAYGKPAAFAYGWTALVAFPAATAALSFFFAELVVEAVGADPTPRRLQAIAAGTVLLLTLASVARVRFGTSIQNGLTVIKVAALLAIVATVFLCGRGDWSHFLERRPVTAGGLSAAAVAILWTYAGWDALGAVAGEVKSPERDFQRALVAGAFGVVALYLAANVAYVYFRPPDALAGERFIGARVMESLLGHGAARAVAFGVACSVLGSLNAGILTRARITYAQARDGLTFAALGRAHEAWGTPHRALLVQQAVAIGLILWMPNFDDLTEYFIAAEEAALLFGVGAVFVLRRKMPEADRPFRTPLYPWVPLLFLVGMSAGFGLILWGEFRKGDFRPLVGLGAALLGFPVYAAWRLISRRATSR